MNKYKFLTLLFLLVSSGVESQELTKEEQTQLNEKLIGTVKEKTLNLKTLEELVHKGADINARDRFGRTTLMLMIIERNLRLSIEERRELVKAFKDKGADFNIIDNEGWSALFWATYYIDFIVWKELVDQGADVHAKNKKDQTLLMIASSPYKRWMPGHGNYLYPYEKQKQFEMMNILIEKEVDVNAKDNEGWTALIYAVYKGDLNVVEFYLDNGADMNVQDINGNTALMVARQKPKIMKAIIKKGADVSIKNNRGQTALQQVPFWIFVEVMTAVRKDQISSFCRRIFRTN